MNIQPLMVRDADARQRAGNPSRSTWHRWTKAGLIPPAIKINGQNYRCLKDLDQALVALGCSPTDEGGKS